MSSFFTKLKTLISALFNLKIDLKVSLSQDKPKVQVNPLLAYALFFFGAYGVIKVLCRTYLSFIHPKIRNTLLKALYKTTSKKAILA
jgi:hypothetical protein